MDLVALKTELDLPAYAGMDDIAAADALNKPERTLDAQSLDGGLLAASFTAAEWTTLLAPARNWLALLVSAGTVPVTPTLKAELQAALPAAVRQRLASRLVRRGSRAEELDLGHVTPSHVADARRL